MSQEQGDEIAHALAGAGGGAVAMVVTYPLITISTVAQTTEKLKANTADEVRATKVRPTALTRITQTATVVAARDIIASSGYRGLYAGIESAIYGITLTNFIYYYFYEAASNAFHRVNARRGQRRRRLSTAQSIVIGAIAGSITCVATNPLWVANTRMMTHKKKLEYDNNVPSSRSPPSTAATIVEIARTEGAKALFAGVLPALVLVVNPIIQYTIFEQIKNAMLTRGGKDAFTARTAFLVGALGKLVATGLTYPYITLKTRMHVKKDQKGASMIGALKRIIAQEGLGGLYNGLLIKLVQSITTAAFLFYFKEEFVLSSVRLVHILRAVSLKRQIGH